MIIIKNKLEEIRYSFKDISSMVKTMFLFGVLSGCLFMEVIHLLIKIFVK